jgi:signal recognition particle subunit SRP72
MCIIVLAIAPKDGDALHCKVIALMQSNEFKAAVDVIDSVANDASLSSLFVLERVYALYRNKQYQVCLDALRGMSDASKTHAIWHLEAQVNYRLANFVRAVEIYERTFTGDNVRNTPRHESLSTLELIP